MARKEKPFIIFKLDDGQFLEITGEGEEIDDLTMTKVGNILARCSFKIIKGDDKIRAAFKR